MKPLPCAGPGGGRLWSCSSHAFHSTSASTPSAGYDLNLKAGYDDTIGFDYLLPRSTTCLCAEVRSTSRLYLVDQFVISITRIVPDECEANESK